MLVQGRKWTICLSQNSAAILWRGGRRRQVDAPPAAQSCNQHEAGLVRWQHIAVRVRRQHVAASAEADFVEEVFVDRLIPARRLPRPPQGVTKFSTYFTPRMMFYPKLDRFWLWLAASFCRTQPPKNDDVSKLLIISGTAPKNAKHLPWIDSPFLVDFRENDIQIISQSLLGLVPFLLLPLGEGLLILKAMQKPTGNSLGSGGKT